MVNILVVDDDPEIIELLKLDLELLRFEVDTARDGLSAVKQSENTHYDLILMDVMMPKLDGYEACRRIRALPHGKDVPIIMLTAKGTLTDKVKGFNAGVDDYLIKPFEFQELMVRMRALFRRTGVLNKPSELRNENKKPEILKLGHLELHPASLEVTKTAPHTPPERIKLTPTEFEILYCLMQHDGEPVKLATLLKDVWGYEADDDVRMLRVHMGLSAKIGGQP
ncbi:MAG: response regulator transcription factor [Vampirovibrionales bacterium]